jgi:hypothetical protein
MSELHYVFRECNLDVGKMLVYEYVLMVCCISKGTSLSLPFAVWGRFYCKQLFVYMLNELLKLSVI